MNHQAELANNVKNTSSLRCSASKVSHLDAVGPYYTSSGVMEVKFILGVVLDIIKVLHLFGYTTSTLV